MALIPKQLRSGAFRPLLRIGTRPEHFAAFFATMTIAAFALFFRLGDPPLYLWDEGRNASNALDMLEHGYTWVASHHGRPDYWNTKPPLAPWLGAASMKIFGISEWALRLPSALAALGTAAALYVFVKNATSSALAPMIAVLSLTGMAGYMEVHVARTADFDSLLVFFSTLATFAVFVATERVRQGQRATLPLFAVAAALFLAFATKSVGGLLMTPAYLAWVMTNGLASKVVRMPYVWGALTALISAVVLLALIMEHAAPGIIKAAWIIDVTGRYKEVSDGNSGPWSYYLTRLLEPWPLKLRRPVEYVGYISSAFPWIFVAPIGLIFAIKSRRADVVRLALFLTVCVGCFLTIISLSATKIPWYVAPIYPLLAACVGIGASELAILLLRSQNQILWSAGWITQPAVVTLTLLFVVLCLVRNNRQIDAAPRLEDQAISLSQSIGKDPALQRYHVVIVGSGRWTTVLYPGQRAMEPFDPQEEFYVRYLRARGWRADLVQPGYRPNPHDLVASCMPHSSASNKIGRCQLLIH